MTETIQLKISAQEKNKQIADENRKQFAKNKLLALNLISSPGSGKTSILEVLSQRLGRQLAVITGDIQTTLDAERITRSGGQAVQVETGGGCHLNAEMVQQKLKVLQLSGVKYLIIENVGNLVCPSSFDLGEHAKAAVLSVAEGDEKPIKYPALFVRAGLVIINKIDLLPYVNFNMERAMGDCRKMNAQALIIKTSCQTQAGFDQLTAYLEKFYQQIYPA
jgi:hydrogenase nickel incorporation protein HypB